MHEKFANLALGYPHLLRMLAVVVVDEVQTIVDSTRGPSLEFLLTLLAVGRKDGVNPQVIALSAVLGDLGGLDSWLEANLIRRTERPVPLAEGVLGPDGVYRHLTPDGREATKQLIPAQPWVEPGREMLIPLVSRLVADGQQVIVFRNIRGKARDCATYLAGALGLPPASDALDALPEGDPSGVSTRLRRCLAGGVAFHISDLDRDEKLVIENQFRAPNSQIRVIVATTTLAQGVNLPAETVIIGELDHPTGRTTTTPYTVAEYKNIAGRAGRLGLTDQGQAIVLVRGGVHTQHRWEHYVTGTPEDLVSRLFDGGTDLYTVVLRVIAVAQDQDGQRGLAEGDVIDFLASSFAAHQQRISGQTELITPSDITPVLAELISSGLVASTPIGVRLSELGALIAQSGLGVRSAVRVAAVLRDLDPTEVNRASLIGAAQLTTELEDLRLPVNSRGWRPEQNTFYTELRRHNISPAVFNAMISVHDRRIAITRAKRTVTCLLWMGGVSIADVERLITLHLPTNDAAGPARQVASRTRDVIGTVIDIAHHLHPSADLTHLAEHLPVQLELGIPPELVPLATQAANTLARPEYLNLLRNNLATPQAILAAEDQELLPCVSGSTSRMRILRDAAAEAAAAQDTPNFADVLPAAND